MPRKALMASLVVSFVSMVRISLVHQGCGCPFSSFKCCRKGRGETGGSAGAQGWQHSSFLPYTHSPLYSSPAPWRVNCNSAPAVQSEVGPPSHGASSAFLKWWIAQPSMCSRQLQELFIQHHCCCLVRSACC